ncbi:hypothetical protein [Oscillibacter sp. ER4]|uniref:hypothetical protein n=1 Tax=Oscillibacter sp. ER4 TaxID=1519439 RepID=UPI0012E0988B|nr:hypothetical protein [Oscillibacter sp. ER4]
MSYYTTVRAKIKVFPVCGHLCGQMWSNPFFAPVLLLGKNPQTTVLQGVPGFGCSHRGYTENRSQSRRATNCATPGYLVFSEHPRVFPKQARYQLRNTPIFNKTPLYYSILERFRKAFLIMVKIVGWLQKCANFRKTKTRKPLCRKALRHFQKMGLTKSYYVPNQARYQLRYTRILLILE